MTEEALPTPEPETTETPAAEAPPANDVVANDVADPEAPANENGEPAKAEPEKPKEESRTALFNRALKMREDATAKLQRAEAAHAEIRREREAFAKEKTEVETWRSQMARIKEDPHLFFEVFDVDPTDHMRKMMALSEPVAREIAQERKARQELEKKLEDERKARESEATSHRVMNAKVSFLDFVGSNAEKFPHLAEAERPALAERFWELASEHHRNTGRVPTIAMVAEYMQKQEEEHEQREEEARAKRLERRQQRGARPATALSEPGGGNTALQRTAPTGSPANGPGPRTPTTLTNGAATAVATALRENATEAEKDAWAAAELRRAFAADAG